MRPRKPATSGSGDLFRARLDQIIDMGHELARLAEAIDREWIDVEVAERFSDAVRRRPRRSREIQTAIRTRPTRGRARTVRNREGYKSSPAAYTKAEADYILAKDRETGPDRHMGGPGNACCKSP